MGRKVIDLSEEKSLLRAERTLVRSQEILQTAKQTLSDEGYAGLSMRAVAAQLGISLSTLQHYYKSKELLVEALLNYVLDTYQAVIADLIVSMNQKTQLERFKAVMDLILIELQKPEVYGVFAEIWALANRNAFAAQLVQRAQARERKEVFKLIHGLNPDMDVETYKSRAAMIVVIIHGLISQLSGPEDPGFASEKLKAAARDNFLKLATEL